METYQQNPNNSYLLWKWQVVYDGIASCNNAIRVTNAALEDQNIKKEEAIQFIAEARFLRGYYHLEAIKMWDFVPYVDETHTGTNILVENRPSTDTEANAGDTAWGLLGGDGHIPWAEVETDCQYAMNHLGEQPRNKEAGRATLYAAMGLMAKLKMYKGDYSGALSLFNAIIHSGMFSLVDNFHENFMTIGDNGAEAIFQIQASISDNSRHPSWGFQANGNWGDAGNGPWAWDFNRPTQNLVNAFKTTDGNVAGVILGLPYLNAYGLDFNTLGDDVINDDGLHSNEPFTPDTRPLDPRLDWTVGRRGIPYLDWGIHPGRDWHLYRAPDLYGPYSAMKHKEHQEYSDTYTGGWGMETANNYSILRYADVLLMAAECEVEADVGSLDRARELVNQVRGRMVDHPEYWVRFDNDSLASNYQIARYPVGGLSDPFQTQNGAREAVRFERRLELGMEGHRFWDLKRWGLAKSTLNAYVEKESLTRAYLDGVVFEDKHIRFPIPQEEIDKSEKTLHQNPGY
jgi:hypothetical protein